MKRIFKDLEKMRTQLSSLSDDDRFNILWDIFCDTKRDIIMKEGSCNDEELITAISKGISPLDKGYKDYLALSVKNLMDY